MLVIAIEGPCCAGKTTLADGIVAALGGSEAVTVVPDYADFVGGGSYMPDPAPPTIAQELHAIDVLLNIETRRFASSEVSSGKARLVIIDRSALTLVGHASGLDWEMDKRYEYRPEVARFVFSDTRAVIPSNVIYLGVTVNEQHRRNRGKFGKESVFMRGRYNHGFEEFFRDSMSPESAWSQIMLDGEQPQSAVLAQGISALEVWDPTLFDRA